MNHKEQLNILINEAPQYGVPSLVMEKVVAPILELVASQLKYSQYYVLNGPDCSWLVTTLSHRQNPKMEKKVIYAFGTRRDAELFLGTANADIQIISVPVTHLLFQLFSVESIDSILFQETPGNQAQQIEIQRTKLYQTIQQQLRHFKSQNSPKFSKIPPNLA